ncbi:MAG: HAD family hydrolase [Frankia sp.]
MEARTLVSFDIDGTLETGDPAGPLRMAFVQWAQGRGYVIGSCSDRTLREQSAMWARAGIVPDFVSRKHELAGVRANFPCQRFVHIGDTRVDEHFAKQADFDFIPVLDLARRLANPLARQIAGRSGGCLG